MKYEDLSKENEILPFTDKDRSCLSEGIYSKGGKSLFARAHGNSLNFTEVEVLRLYKVTVKSQSTCNECGQPVSNTVIETAYVMAESEHGAVSQVNYMTVKEAEVQRIPFRVRGWSTDEF